MAQCETCGNEYDKPMEITLHGQSHLFDSFECAIDALAPECSHCGCKVIGHGVEEDGTFYCCAHCANQHGAHPASDRVGSSGTDRDALYRRTENRRERGDSAGRAAKNSFYAPLLTGAAVLGAAWTVTSLMSSGGGRRTGRTHHDGNHLGLAQQVRDRSEWRYAESEQPPDAIPERKTKIKSQIHENMNVRGSDGYPVGKVDKVEGEWIKLTKDNQDEVGQHHYIDVNEVRTVEGDVVCLNQPADEIKRKWHGEPLA